jgi:signal peptidase I
MKSSIIKSESSLKRYPVLAFILSFLFTGLGQIYNGDFSKGIALFILRILSLIFIPLFVILQSNFSIIFVLAASAFQIFVWFFSSVEAACLTKGKHAFNLKKYNTILFYFFYIIINSILLIFSIFLIISVFSIKKIQTDDMNPVLLKNDYILINKYIVNNIGVGDIIYFTSKNNIIAGRIIAGDADIISKKGNNYYINDAVLSYSIISKPELEKMGLRNSEDLFFEINGEKKYPVKIKSDKNKNLHTFEQISISKGEYLIAFDNRVKNDFYEIVNLNSIQGKIEGIIFSKELTRIFNIIYLHVNR